MRSRQTLHSLLIAALAAGLAIPAFADDAGLQPVHSGNITYVTGGFGQSEQHALKAAAKDYNLEITNAIKSGAFTSGTNLLIQSAKGDKVLSVSDTGPLFYAKLPPGRYTIHAINGDETRVRDVTIGERKSADLHLIWHQVG